MDHLDDGGTCQLRHRCMSTNASADLHAYPPTKFLPPEPQAKEQILLLRQNLLAKGSSDAEDHAGLGRYPRSKPSDGAMGCFEGHPRGPRSQHHRLGMESASQDCPARNARGHALSNTSQWQHQQIMTLPSAQGFEKPRNELTLVCRYVGHKSTIGKWGKIYEYTLKTAQRRSNCKHMYFMICTQHCIDPYFSH